MSDTDFKSSTNFVINPQYRLQWEAAQNCHVLLYPEGMVQLSDSAAAILQHCQKPTDTQTLIGRLREQFPGADLEDDVKEFIADARQQQWLVNPAG